jgi:hypothetical protein
MAGYATGKYALAISDRSGLRFPYSEMVREWNGSLVHTSEYESKQPQLTPAPVGSDPQALHNPRPQRASVVSLILLNNNPFTTIISGGVTYVNIYSLDHQRKTGDIVRFRGFPIVTEDGTEGSNAHNLQQFSDVPTFDNVSDLNNVNGFTITVGKIEASGNIVTAPNSNPTEILTTPESYFFITSTSNATSGGVSGGELNCSVGPVTLEVVGGN